MAERMLEMDCAPGMVHRYLRGLRFEGLWRYGVLDRCRRLRWKTLPLPSPFGREADDPDGAHWGVCGCVAVLGQRIWPRARSQVRLRRHPNVPEVMQALRRALPGWAPQVMHGEADVATKTICEALEQGGCALVRLKYSRGTRPVVTWAWVVGVEVGARVRALLVTGVQWPAPWGCGYGARLRALATGDWQVLGTDGQSQVCEGARIVILAPDKCS